MPVHPVDAPYEGIGLDLDCIIGTCRDEANLFTMQGMGLENLPFGHRTETLLKAGNADHELAKPRRLTRIFSSKTEAKVFRLIRDIYNT